MRTCCPIWVSIGTENKEVTVSIGPGRGVNRTEWPMGQVIASTIRKMVFCEEQIIERKMQ